MRFLVVIDAQNDFIDGVLRNEEAIKRVPNIVKEIREGGWDAIIATQDTHYSNNYLDTAEGRKLPIPHCIKGSEGWKINKEVLDAIQATTENFAIQEKSTFGSPALANIFCNFFEDCRIDGIEADDETLYIEFVGFCTDICVISNALMVKTMVERGTVAVKESCCAGVTKEGHDIALKAMQACHIDIID